jgi:hypothetical protein
MQQAINSTTLAALAYDRSRQQLHLKFRDHAVYTYFGVPEQIYEGLLRAPSKGQYFNARIRCHFEYKCRTKGHDDKTCGVF